jgi:hypothetical protein
MSGASVSIDEVMVIIIIKITTVPTENPEWREKKRRGTGESDR